MIGSTKNRRRNRLKKKNERGEQDNGGSVRIKKKCSCTIQRSRGMCKEMGKKMEGKKAEFSGTILGPVSLIKDAKDALINWSCSYWRSSSEMVAKVLSDPWMGEVDADFFFWSEQNSSIICAFIGGVLLSWQIPLYVSCVWIFASPLRAKTPTLEWAIGAC